MGGLHLKLGAQLFADTVQCLLRHPEGLLPSVGLSLHRGPAKDEAVWREPWPWGLFLQGGRVRWLCKQSVADHGWRMAWFSGVRAATSQPPHPQPQCGSHAATPQLDHRVCLGVVGIAELS